MTLIASLREVGSDVIRVCRALVILQVASHASCARQVVIVVHVTIGTGTRRNGVQTGQSKAGRGVVELGISPGHGIVALLARRGEPIVRHGCRRVVVIRLMTTNAGGIGDVVIVVDVAIRASAWRDHVRTGQGESRIRVIECCGLPGRGVVTNLASLRESAGHVIGIRCSLKILHVAGHARVGCQVVIVVAMAIGASARRNRVRAGQREVHTGMVEGCR